MRTRVRWHVHARGVRWRGGGWVGGGKETWDYEMLQYNYGVHVIKIKRPTMERQPHLQAQAQRQRHAGGNRQSLLYSEASR